MADQNMPRVNSRIAQSIGLLLLFSSTTFSQGGGPGEKMVYYGITQRLFNSQLNSYSGIGIVALLSGTA